MKTIVLLAALSCLIGFAGAQTMSGLGHGYSSSQQAFYNAPSTSTFEPNVQSYWGNYIASQKNLSVAGGTPEMQIWMNHFPLSFDSPLQLKATSFNGSAAAPNSRRHREKHPVSDQKHQEQIRYPVGSILLSECGKPEGV